MSFGNIAPASALLAAVATIFSGQASAASAQTWSEKIHVGIPVQVSLMKTNQGEWETTLAADPEKPHLLACSIHASDISSGSLGRAKVSTYNQCYYSLDKGKNWGKSDMRGIKTRIDPIASYGPNDTIYFTGTGNQMMRSTDAGKTFVPTKSIGYKGEDRPWILADTKVPGKVYLIDGCCFYVSLDGGDNLKELPSPLEQRIYVGSPIVALPEGGVGMVGKSPPKGSEGASLDYYVYKDGAAALEKRGNIAKSGRARWGAQRGSVAVDATGAIFDGRLYYAWVGAYRYRNGASEIIRDVSEQPRSVIYISYSDDDGHTWSPPFMLNDERLPKFDSEGPDHAIPAVAVNKYGVVAVTWYSSDLATTKGRWQRRGAISLDGGETFSPSIAISPWSDGTDAMLIDGDAHSMNAISGKSGASGIVLYDNIQDFRDTAGLVADPDGVFHAAWISYQDGRPQTFTAPISISAKAQRHGDPALSKLADVTSELDEVIEEIVFDRESGTAAVKVAFKNTSKTSLKGPFVTRVRDLTSARIEGRFLNADNQEQSRGAEWQFVSGNADGQLKPGEVTVSRELKIQIKSDVSDVTIPDYKVGLDWQLPGIRVNWQVFGQTGSK